jgi:hypothetical protein
MTKEKELLKKFKKIERLQLLEVVGTEAYVVVKFPDGDKWKISEEQINEMLMQQAKEKEGNNVSSN